MTQKCPKTLFHAAVSDFSIGPRIHLMPSVCKQHSRSPKTPTIRRPLSSRRGPPILRSNFPERPPSELFCLLLHTSIWLVCIISLASLSPLKVLARGEGKGLFVKAGCLQTAGESISQTFQWPDFPFCEPSLARRSSPSVYLPRVVRRLHALN